MSTMLHHGRVYSPASRAATAMLIDDDRVAWIGDDASAAGMSADEWIDLAGGLVTPAFVDGHFHATATGLALTGLDLSHSTSLVEALAALEKRARAARGRPLIGSGWDETRWPEGRSPTAAELDRASYGGVVYLARADVHSAVASSALMATVPGLSAQVGYHPSGLLTKDAHHCVRAVALAAITATQRTELQRAALAHAASRGIAAVHEMAGPDISGPEDLQGLARLAGCEPLPRVFGFWGELGAISLAKELGAVSAGGDLFCDGSLGSHTAALSEPYADSGEAGLGYLRYETAELVEHIIACTEAGLLTGFHAIGDAATAQVVEAMVRAEHSLGAARVSGAGHRIEHAEMIGDVAALAASGLTASVQPAFDAAWGGSQGMYSLRLGTERASRLNPFAELARAGVALVFGSDSPVTMPDPWGALRAAVHPTNARHALSARAAFSAHTRGGWRSVRADGSGSGTLSPGAPATYAIFNIDARADGSAVGGSAFGGSADDRRADANYVAEASGDERIARWSTDEGSALSALPDLTPGLELPRCQRTVLDGVVLFDAQELS